MELIHIWYSETWKLTLDEREIRIVVVLRNVDGPRKSSPETSETQNPSLTFTSQQYRSQIDLRTVGWSPRFPFRNITQLILWNISTSHRLNYRSYRRPRWLILRELIFQYICFYRQTGWVVLQTTDRTLVSWLKVLKLRNLPWLLLTGVKCP